MKPLPLKLWAPAALLLPLALGYVWPYSAPEAVGPAAARWHWPEQQAPSQPAPAPELLARFWPLSEPDPAAEKPATADQPWRLVAVIEQGGRLQATLLGPKGRLHTLGTGDMLDENRRITAIEATQIHWQHDEQQGTLALFPRPHTEPEQITNEN